MSGAAPRPRGYQLALVELAKTRNAASLAATVPLRVRSLTGDDGLDTWSQAQWAALLASAEVLVATPQCVVEALSKSFLKLRDVRLLVLDECHHAAKNHPMNQVMRFYALLPEAHRPRVLGLTASPVHGMGAPARAIAQLESNLFCKIVTALDWTEVAHHSPCPALSVEPYDGPDADAAAVAAASLHCGKGAALRARRVFAAALSPLGLWGAAAALQAALSREPWGAAAGASGPDEDAGELVAPPQLPQSETSARIDAGAAQWQRANGDALAADVDAAVAQAPPLISRVVGADAVDCEQYEPHLRRAGYIIDAILRASPPARLLELASAAENGNPSEAVPWVSGKVAALLRVLRRYAGAADGWRCLVFCERRDTAVALAALLRALAAAPASPWAFLRPASQTGYAGASAAAVQRTVLAAFRGGACNCVCATAVLEEGVDVPECALVMLFDLARNVKSFIQARGRARAAVSQIAVLAPRVGGAHAALLARVTAAEDEMRAASMRRASLLAAGGNASDDDEEEALRHDSSGALHVNGPTEYIVPATGARVALAAAPALIHHYVSKLPHDRYCEHWRPNFAVQPCGGGGYACTLTLPAHVWLPPVDSGPQPSKRVARAVAALAAVAALHAGGALTNHLIPSKHEPDAGTANAGAAEMHESLQADVDADVAALRCGSKEPDVLLTSPHAGKLGDDGSAGALLGEWHVTELAPLGPQAESDAHPVPLCRLGLLTRHPLPPLPPLRLRARGRAADRRSVALGTVTLHDADREAALRRFLAWANASWFERHTGVGTFSPLAAPLAPSGAELDWPMLCAHDAIWNAPTCSQPDDAAPMVGCVVWTRHTGLRAFYALRCRDDVGVDTLVHADASTSLGDHFLRRHGISPAVLQAGSWLDGLPAPTAPRNMLPQALPAATCAAADAAAAEPLKAPSPMLLPSVLCSFEAASSSGRCPAPLWRALSVLPGQLWRLRGLLLAQELAQRLLPSSAGDVALVAALAEATTAAAAGEDVSLERLELLGDAFLKYAVSAALFANHPRAHEGQLSTARAARVCNVSLAAAARAAGLHTFLRARRFTTGAALPPAQLGRKTLADLLEAVVGAVLATQGPDAAAAVAAALRVLPAVATETQAVLRAPMLPLRACDDVALASLSRLEAQLQFAFSGSVPCRARAGRLALLDEALTHASSPACAGGAPAYQRLEFLGDAAIDLLATRALFSAAGQSAGALTAARSAAVCNERLASRAATLGLARYLRHGSPALHRDMLVFVMAQAASASGAPRAPPPKVLADVFEAVVGAVLLDSGLDLEATWRVVAPLLALDDPALRGARSPVAEFFEAAMAAHVRCALVVEPTHGDAAGATDAAALPTCAQGCDGVAVSAVLNGAVVACGTGSSKAKARRAAAAAALAVWPAALVAARATSRPDGRMD